jgi:hypothetical protein
VEVNHHSTDKTKPRNLKKKLTHFDWRWRVNLYLEQEVGDIIDKLRSSEDRDIVFELQKVENGIVEVQLLVGPKTCSECILPEQTWAAILLNEIQKDLPIIREVKVYKTTRGGD